MKERLLGLGEFYYWPNDGNLGDLLIAEATRQYFSRNGIKWKEFDPDNPPNEESYNLVYGGGGRFTSHWSGIDKNLALLTAPCVKKGIILPHSFYQVDDFLRALDGRHTVMCREKRSYEYVLSLHARAEVLLEEDLGLQLDVHALPPLSSFPFLPPEPDRAKRRQRFLWVRQWPWLVAQGVRMACVRALWQGRRAKIAFLLRTDREKSSRFQSPIAYDISASLTTDCFPTPYNAYLIRAFAEALRYPDVVVTDRLHVGIMACLVGKKTYLLDNDYGKISGVYEQSLQKNPGVHLLAGSELTPELLEAWRLLNSSRNRKLHALACRKKNCMARLRRQWHKILFLLGGA